jgi:hypothetical protein
MSMRALTSALLILFLLSAILGLFVVFGSMQHEAGCASAHDHAVLCDAPLEHLGHWQSAFAAVVSLFVFAVGAIILVLLIRAPRKSSALLRCGYGRTHVPRPTTLQELLSSGLLHPKVP